MRQLPAFLIRRVLAPHCFQGAIDERLYPDVQRDHDADHHLRQLAPDHRLRGHAQRVFTAGPQSIREAVYTGDSPVNATTLGGPTLVNNGVILDTSPVESANEYAIQSVGAVDFTLVNHGLVSASNFIALGMNDGKILVATKHGRTNGRSGVPDVLGAAINRRVHRDALHVSIVGWSIGELSVIWLDVDMLPTCWSPPLRVVFTATAGTPV